MAARWVTKYGARRVRVDLPTVEEALYAAEGLTSDMLDQIQIAAELMQLPVDQVRAEAERIAKTRRPQIMRTRRTVGSVIVEQRATRRKYA